MSDLEQDLIDLMAEGNSPPVHLDFDDLLTPMAAEIKRLRAEVERMTALYNTPATEDYMTAVRTEAAHQIERWGTWHDTGKTDPDWFWLVGYLAGKALHDIRGKKTHHIIACAAALLNWHRAVTGESNVMRPGIEEPA